jgi:hypothetical protein
LVSAALPPLDIPTERRMSHPLVSDLGGFSQIGLVVADAERTMRYMGEKLGIGPFFVLRDIKLDNFWYRGASSPSPLLTVGLAQCGGTQFEVIQQHDDVPSVYRECVEGGREGCQHLALWFAEREGFDEAHGKLAGQGLRLVQSGGSLEKTRFAYFEAEVPGLPMIELSESLMPRARGLAAGVAQANRDWTGEDPLRIGALPL